MLPYDRKWASSSLINPGEATGSLSATLPAAAMREGREVGAVSRHIDLLADLLLVRRLQPLIANVGKRLIKSPKVYVRDIGLLHALLSLRSLPDVLGHSVAGSSREGSVLGSLLAVAPDDASAAFCRTAAGAEVDLVLDLGGEKDFPRGGGQKASPSVL